MATSGEKQGLGALVLLSGGLDSAVASCVASFLGYHLHGVTFSYGQRHTVEVSRAADLARGLRFETHRVLEIERFPVGASALTDESIAVPEHRSAEEIGVEIPRTYVPARNTIFLSYALAWCEGLGLAHIFLGVNSLDYSGYPDCRPEYLRAFEQLANLGTRAGVEGTRLSIHAPLLHRTKAEIIRLGTDLRVDFSATWSCYAPVPVRRRGSESWRHRNRRDAEEVAACGSCDSCLLRRRGFQEAGVPDPTVYASITP